MSSSATKWVTGCGIALLIGIVALAALIYGGYRFGKRAMEEVREVEVASRALKDRLGEPSAFTPDADGTIRPERVEAFLNARAGMAPYLDELESTLAVLDGSDSTEGESTGFLGKGAAGIRLFPRIFGFYTERSKACLAAEIGLGEYTYIYVLGYYGLLHKSVASGPGFDVVTSGHRDGADSRRRDDFSIREDRRELVLSTARNLFLSLLQNQLDALQADRSSESVEWEAVLRDEIGKLQADRFRLPWSDGLPERIAVSLEPYRDRFESSWSEMCNAVEVGPQVH